MSERTEDTDRVKAAWQGQSVDVPRISLELVRHHVDKLNADLREQNMLMYFGIAIMVGILPFVLMKDSRTFLWVGLLLAVFGAGYLMIEIRRRSRTLGDSGGNVMQTLDAYRAELERRRDYYLHSWRWSIWPMIPSVLVLLVGGAVYGTRPDALSHSIRAGLFAVVATWVAVWHHRRKGRAYQRELDAFESLKH